MTLAQVVSKGGVPLRITAERWAHIIENHDYMAGNLDRVIETLQDPDYIVRGSKGAKLALKHYTATVISEKDLVAIYREVGAADGFLITAFMTSKGGTHLRKGALLWRRLPR
jgi:predicted RNA-binding Zn ribbon-like protein